MTRSEVFTRAWDAFVPNATDSPDAIPFYRAFAGLRAAWGSEFCETYNAAVHQAACSCAPGRGYDLALAVLRDMVDRAEPPREPWQSGYWSMRPEPGDEERAARDMFNVQFKNRFPGERANSKHANALWPTLCDKAVQMVRDRHGRAVAAWEAEDACIRAENARRRQDWLDKLHGMALFEDAVRTLDRREPDHA